MRTYSVGVIGAGAGGQLSMRAAQASDRLTLRAVTDLRPEALAAVRATIGDLATFDSHLAMFEQCPTDLVCVSTYAPSHLSLTQAALALPLVGMLVEKPLADTAAAGRAVIDAVRAKGLPLAVPHGLLALRHGREILDRVRQGEIGDLRTVEIQCSRWDIINAGIHWLNFFVNLTNLEPISTVLCAADASTRTWRDGMQVETEAVVMVRTVSGVRCLLQHGDDLPTVDGKMIFRLWGSRGRLEFWGWEQRYWLQNEQYPQGLLVDAPSERGGHQVHLEDLLDQVETGRRDYTVAESSQSALELVEAAYRSARERCAVQFPLADFLTPPASDWDPGRPYAGSGGGRDGRQL